MLRDGAHPSHSISLYPLDRSAILRGEGGGMAISDILRKAGLWEEEHK